MKKSTSFTLLIYGIMVTLGGVMGFIKAGSVASLIMGCGFGLTVIFSRKNRRLGFPVLLVCILDAFFSYRFYLSMKWMPAGLMLTLSSAVLLLIIFQNRKQPSRTSP